MPKYFFFNEDFIFIISIPNMRLQFTIPKLKAACSTDWARLVPPTFFISPCIIVLYLNVFSYQTLSFRQAQSCLIHLSISILSEVKRAFSSAECEVWRITRIRYSCFQELKQYPKTQALSPSLISDFIVWLFVHILTSYSFRLISFSQQFFWIDHFPLTSTTQMSSIT